jgi:arginase family enzyme
LIFAGCQPPGAGGRESGLIIELTAPGPEVRQASHRLGSFSPRLDRELAELAPLDVGEPRADLGAPPLGSAVRRAMLRETAPPFAVEALPGSQTSLRVLALGGTLQEACHWGELLGPGRVYALGGRAYDRASRDFLRSTQRLLPWHEIDLKTAVLSAVKESGADPLWVSLGLDLLAPHLVPGVAAVAPGGATLEALQAALETIPGERVIGFAVTGYPDSANRNEFTALTAAELLRDNILTWWGTPGARAFTGTN